MLKAFLTRLIQNGFTGEAKAGEARKTDFFWLLVHFNPGLQNGFTLQCLDLRKIDEAGLFGTTYAGFGFIYFAQIEAL